MSSQGCSGSLIRPGRDNMWCSCWARAATEVMGCCPTPCSCCCHHIIDNRTSHSAVATCCLGCCCGTPCASSSRPRPGVTVSRAGTAPPNTPAINRQSRGWRTRSSLLTSALPVYCTNDLSQTFWVWMMASTCCCCCKQFRPQQRKQDGAAC